MSEQKQVNVNDHADGQSGLNSGLADLPTIATCLAARFEGMLKGGTIESFSEEMDKFLDSTADDIGDFIGAACENPRIAFDRFGDRLAAAISRRIEAANAGVTGAEPQAERPR